MIQLAIGLCGLLALSFAMCDNPTLRKWAPIIGLLGQPAWALFAYQTGGWGLGVLVAAYTLIYLRAAVLEWRPVAASAPCGGCVVIAVTDHSLAFPAFRARLMGAIAGVFPVPPVVPPPLWGFFWTDCVYESGLMLQSLHASKAGAVAAMVRAQSDRWAACRTGAGSGLHTGLSQREQDYRTLRRFEAFAVRPVEVLP